MKAVNLDAETDCPICGGDGIDPIPDAQTNEDVQCRRCDGTGRINRFGPNDPSHTHSGDHVISREQLLPNGAVFVEKMPITSEDTGGFNGRYGDWTPQDVTTGPMADYQQDTKDRLQNKPLGTSTNSNGVYDLPDEEPYNGRNLSESDLPNGWLGDGTCSACNGQDICPTCTMAWLRARGDEFTASVLESVVNELNLQRP